MCIIVRCAVSGVKSPPTHLCRHPVRCWRRYWRRWWAAVYRAPVADAIAPSSPWPSPPLPCAASPSAAWWGASPARWRSDPTTTRHQQRWGRWPISFHILSSILCTVLSSCAFSKNIHECTCTQRSRCLLSLWWRLALTVCFRVTMQQACKRNMKHYYEQSLLYIPVHVGRIHVRHSDDLRTFALWALIQTLTVRM